MSGLVMPWGAQAQKTESIPLDDKWGSAVEVTQVFSNLPPGGFTAVRVSVKNEGITEFVEELDRHQAWLLESGELENRRRRRAAEEIEVLAVTALRERMGDLSGGDLLGELADEVLAGKTDPYAAADRLVAAVEG